jgi:hypothetical protein
VFRGKRQRKKRLGGEVRGGSTTPFCDKTGRGFAQGGGRLEVVSDFGGEPNRQPMRPLGARGLGREIRVDN